MTAGTEVAVHRQQASAIPAKLQYAEELANSGLLPAAYRRNPANVLWAVEYGEMLGLPPMAAMTGVHVIEGKPTASAGLISALVRRAGHKLRVSGDAQTATCQVIRADDPDYTFEVTWTLRKNAAGNPSAEEAGLLGKNVWKNYPASMLKSRAITQCARDACEEVLFGLHYSPEELGAEVDADGEVVAGPRDVSEPELADEARTHRASQAPADDTWRAASPSPEQAWLALALESAPKHSSLDACGVAWKRSVDHANAGKLTREEVAPLHDALRARIAILKESVPADPAEDTEVVDAEVVEDVPALDPDDPWLAAIEGLADADEAGRLLDDLLDQLGRTEIDPVRASLVEAAVLARFPDAIKTPAAAA